MTTEQDGITAKAQAEALFKRAGHGEVDDVRQAKEAARQAEAEKTARLRSLRLAKEESDRIAAEIRRARWEQHRL